jgi:hypothetical protein
MPGRDIPPLYDNATTYVERSAVTYDSKVYGALQTTTGNAPTNADYWKQFGVVV